MMLSLALQRLHIQRLLLRMQPIHLLGLNSGAED